MGIPTINIGMATLTAPTKKRVRSGITVTEEYSITADAKRLISLRNSKSKHFNVKKLSNGSFLVEPAVLVPMSAVPARTLRMIERSVANLRKGIVSDPVDLSAFG